MPEFKNAVFLLLLLPVAAYYIYFRSKVLSESSVLFPSEKMIKKKKSLFRKTYFTVPLMRFLAIIFAIIALARPGKGVSYTEIENYGVDIVIALDLSLSMQGMDFQPNRLVAAKEMVSRFIANRENDRIGLVVFAGEAYLQAPLTSDKEIIREIVDEADFDSVETDGTAIGEAIVMSAARLKESKAESRIILLLTDGVNNRGVVDPSTAALAAKELGVKIYSVGIGKDGNVAYPTGNVIFSKRNILNQFDEKLLKSITELTGGKYYRAADQDSFERSISDINMLEKSRYKVKKFYDFEDNFFPFLAASVIFFFAEIILRSVVYRKIP
ncbi:MAG: VWA domain-containing protein [Spirochaetes bacterium]|nr:VWA domain-containing protein [Spirochaetota bacterium]